MGISDFSLRCRAGHLAAVFTGLALLGHASCAGTKTVILPFHSVHSLILIDARVNGNRATLLVDTGANHTIINVKMYGNVQAPPIEAVSKGPGIVGDALRLRTDLEIAGRFLFSQPVSVMNLDGLPKHLGAQFDGLLGQD